MSMHLQEEFVIVNTPMQRVEAVMTERNLMELWMSPAVRFEPLDDWRFATGDRWRMTLTGVGDLLHADYVVHDRQPGLVLWAFNGFWEGFDAWRWLPDSDAPAAQTIIQNRIEYEIRIPGLDLLWPVTVGPLMGWDARVQMQRLKRVCEDETSSE
ncbi:MAG: SRPBCC family protein [Chloroflexales bacterium]|nr:SRPBCC family protein [Chloroflexales bacterium]